ncbi:MAG: AAA family ATPase [Xanthobacteraceae bacterium]
MTSAAEILKQAQEMTAIPELVPLVFRYADVKATPWVAKGFGLRGAVTILGATGGTGKTQATLQCAVAFALGEDFGGFHPMRPLRTVFVSAEEPNDEIQRRLLAIAIDMVGDDEAKVNALMEKLEREKRLLIYHGKNVALVSKDGEKGAAVARTAFHERICLDAESGEFDVVILDPIARLHSGLDENASEMQELHNAADELARRGNCAVVLVHHTRKSSRGDVGDQYAARGASAMTDAARVVLIMANMTEDEAKIHLSADKQNERDRYCKIGDPKQSYAANARVRWFQKVPITLPVLLEDNSPDARFVLRPWKPEAPDTLSQPWLPEFLDRIKKGPGGGAMYTTSRTGPKPPRADALLMDKFKVPKGQTAAVLRALVEAGEIVIRKRTQGTKGHEREVDVYEIGGLPF